MLIWVILFSGISIGLFWYARHQPFPEHGNIAGSFFLLTALVLYIALEAPRPTAGTQPGSPVPPFLAIILGGWFTIIGGIILVSGIFGFVTIDWTDQTTTEQIGNFILASIFVLLEIYLLFRGLVVGIQGITWSKSGLRQLERGLIQGERGAISHFERSWDMEDPALSAMAHAALALIHKYNGDSEKYEIHINRLDRFGGWESVDPSWLDVVNTRLHGNAILESSE